MHLAQAGLGLLCVLFFAGNLSSICTEERPTDPQPVIHRESSFMKPRILITILARNAQHSLPYFLGCIDRLDYPKERISIWAASDHNVDNTSAILQEWLGATRSQYHSVEWRPLPQPSSYAGELGPKHWTAPRFTHLMKLKQTALQAARKVWADYILFVDSDNLLTNRHTLTDLLGENVTLVAPMLESRGLYSNFWCGVTPEGYYRRTPEYVPIRGGRQRGCFAVPMVHSTLLLDLRRSASPALAFHPPHPRYPHPLDDIMVFAFSARRAGVQMHVCNKEHYGYLPLPLKQHQTVEEEEESFTHTLTEALIDFTMEPSQYVHHRPRQTGSLGFNKVFLINLERRSDRRRRMLRSLRVLGVNASVTEAVDGKALNSSQIKALGIDVLPGYRDPYSDRTLTRGEVGCFLSHYNIWKQVATQELQEVLVLEDDVRFEPRFCSRLKEIMNSVKTAGLDWDLIYLGRKRLQVKEPEVWVTGVSGLVHPDYSYWTLGYALSSQGASKLLDSKPLSKMLPIDEFLPIMFNKHPNEDYLRHFEPRDLRAFSAEPLLLFPTHYTGQPGYVSDTETSTLWDDDGAATDWDRGGGGGGGVRRGAGPGPQAEKEGEGPAVTSAAQREGPEPAPGGNRDEL